MKKETNGIQIDDEAMSWRRFHLEALKFMGEMGLNAGGPHYWVADSLDASEMIKATAKLKREQGMAVTVVDLTICWNEIQHRFELPRLERSDTRRQVLILNGFNDVAVPGEESVWLNLREPLRKFVSRTGGIVFAAYSPIVGKTEQPIWVSTNDLHSYKQAVAGPGEITVIESLADRSASFSECIDSPDKMRNWIEKKWFPFLAKESESKRRLILEVVKKLSVLPGSFTDFELAEAMSWSLDELKRTVGLPWEFKDYDENRRSGQEGKELYVLKEILLRNAMMGWQSEKGGYVIAPSLRLPMEMVYSFKERQRYHECASLWSDYYQTESVNCLRFGDVRARDLAKYYLAQKEAIEKRESFIYKKTQIYFGKS